MTQKDVHIPAFCPLFAALHGEGTPGFPHDLVQSIKQPVNPLVLTRNRARIGAGSTGAETRRQLKELLSNAGSTWMAHTPNLGANTGVSAAPARPVIAYKWSRVKLVRV